MALRRTQPNFIKRVGLIGSAIERNQTQFVWCESSIAFDFQAQLPETLI